MVAPFTSARKCRKSQNLLLRAYFRFYIVFNY